MSKRTIQLSSAEEDRLAQLQAEGVTLQDLVRAALLRSKDDEELVEEARRGARIESRGAGQSAGLDKEDVQRALNKHGSRNAAAEALGITQQAVAYWVNRYVLDVPGDE